jgi:lysophospholipase L1-like esterase
MFIAPDHPLIQYTDCFAVDVTAERARFRRPSTDSFGFGHCNPGARVRFMTDAGGVTIRLRHTALMTRRDTFRNIGAILVDGEIAQYFRHVGKWNATGDIDVAVSLGAGRAHVVEIVMPYGISVDFVGIDVAESSRLIDAPPRPSTRFVAYGDSVTHGYSARDATRSWAYRLAALKHWQLINLGFGGKVATPSDAGAIAAAKPDVVAIQVGYNDFAQQRPLGEFVMELYHLLRDVQALCPNAAIHYLTPLWSGSDKLLPLKLYRAAAADAAKAAQGERLHAVDGLALVDHDEVYFKDRAHLNDFGMRQMAERLAEKIAQVKTAG